MAIIKYKDKDGNLQPLGATGDHSHSLESLGAAAKNHPHNDATTSDSGFMSSTDKANLDKLHKTIYGDKQQENGGLVGLVGDTKVEEQIKAAVANFVTTDGTKGLSANDYTDDDKEIVDSVEKGAEVNQNAFSEVVVGTTKISAGNETDSITLTAGANITLTPDADNKTVTIIAKDTEYELADDSNNGLISSSDYKKLKGIADGATNVIVDNKLDKDSTHAVQNASVTSAINALNTLVGDTAVDKQIETAVQDCISGISVDGVTISYTTTGGGTGSITTQDSQYSVMLGAKDNADGEEGLVPKPNAGDQDKFLKADGTWATPTDHTYKANNGIALNGDTFSNSGVRSVGTGDANGTIKVDTNGTSVDVAVKGLGSAAYTNADDYDKAKAAETALDEAKKYTDGKFSTLVGDTKVDTQIESAVKDCITGLSVSGTTITYTQAGGGSGTITTQDTNTTEFTITASAEDDDVVVLSGTNGSNQVTYKAAHAKKGPTSGYKSGNATTSISGFGSSGTIKIPQITVDTYGHVTAAADEEVSITMPSKPTVATSVSENVTNAVSSGAVYTAIKAVSDKVGDTKVSDQISAAIENHSHKYAGSSEAGGAATSANKVNNSLTIQLNGGTTADTNKFTFNGSAAKTVNITPSSIGAAATSHGNHVPTIETANNAKFLRNDNSWQTVTPGNIGAASSTHNHDGTYAKSSHTHDYASSTHNHDGTYAAASHGNHIPSGGSSGKYLKWSTSGTATWADPPSTSVSTMVGATSSTNGTAGLVPQPTAGDNNLYLRGDGNWATPPGTYSLPIASDSVLGGIKVGTGLKINSGVLSTASHSHGDTYYTKQAIQSGYKIVSVVNTEQTATIDIAFPSSFDQQPSVVAFVNSCTNVSPGKVSIYSTSASKTGCTLKVYNADVTKNATNVYVSWIAIGDPSS